MLLVFPVLIALNGTGYLNWTGNDWGVFITSYIFILLGFSVLVAINDGSSDKL
jgi:hypothetical protein